jgi:hypothetical protein
VLVRDGKTIIVVDAETAARNALGMKRYVKDAAVDTPVDSINPVDTPSPAGVDTDAAAARREYKRNWMRRQRGKE